MIVLLLIVLGFMIRHYFYLESRPSSRLLKTIPGPPTLPIIGNALDFVLLDKKTLWDYLRNFSDKYTRGKLTIFSKHVVFLRDPKDLQISLMHPYTSTKGFVYKYFEDWLGDGMFVARGYRWRTQRKLSVDAFNVNALSASVKIIDHCMKDTIDKLRSAGKENVYKLKHLTSFLIRSPSFATIGNVDVDKLDSDIIENFVDAVDQMTEVVSSRTLHPYLPRWYYFNKFTSYGRKNLKSIEGFNKITKEVLSKRQIEDKYSISLLNQGILEESDIENNDFPLDLLLKAHQNGEYNQEEVNVYVNSAFFGIFDTSRKTLAYTLLLLAENKEIQDKVRAEVTAVLEESGGKLEMEELKKLNYLEMCIKESLRLFPIAPMIFRYTERDVQLENQIIPGGTEVGISIFDVHRDPKYWPEPNKYDPDRFLPDNVNERHPFVYLPFSAGPRNCLGQKYAMLLMKSIIGRLLYNFYVEPVDYIKDLTFIADVTINTTNEIRAKFIRIDRDDTKNNCDNWIGIRCLSSC